MDRFLEMTCSLVLVGSALAFGGVDPLTYSLAEIVLLAVLLSLLIKQLRDGKVHLLLVPVGPVLFLMWAALAVVPLPAGFVGAISPAHLAAPNYTPRSSGVLSIAPHLTVVALFKFLGYFVAFVLAANLFDSRKRRSILVGALIVLGCFEASYGIVQYLTNWHKIFTYTNIFDLSNATGTYINRNHFAGLLELTMPFVLAAAFYSFQKASNSRHVDGGGAASQRGAVNFQALFYLLLLVVSFVALVFSRSRGGILAASFGMVFVVLLGQIRAGGKAWILFVVFFLTLIVGYSLWIGLNPVLARFEQIGEKGFLQNEARAQIWKDTLGLLREFPVTGSGLGTYGNF